MDAVAALGDYEGPTRFLCARAEVGTCCRPAASPVTVLLHPGPGGSATAFLAGLRLLGWSPCTLSLKASHCSADHTHAMMSRTCTPQVEVPEELVRLLMPRVQQLLDQSHGAEWEGSWLQCQLENMLQFARVVIQDAAAMPEEMSSHCVVKLLATHPKWRWVLCFPVFKIPRFSMMLGYLLVHD